MASRVKASRFRLPLLTSDPADFVEGELGWRSDLKQFRGHNGDGPFTLGQGAVDPADFGFLAYNFQPDLCTAASTPLAVAGTIYGVRLELLRPATITNLEIGVVTAGASLTANQCLAALYDSAGNLLAATGNQAATWNSIAAKHMALTTAQVAAPAGYYDVCFFFNGTTGPAFNRAGGVGQAAFVNGLATGQALRYFTANTGRTTTFPAALGTKTATAATYWAGLS